MTPPTPTIASQIVSIFDFILVLGFLLAIPCGLGLITSIAYVWYTKKPWRWPMIPAFGAPWMLLIYLWFEYLQETDLTMFFDRMF